MKRLSTLVTLILCSGIAWTQTLSTPSSGGNQKSKVTQYIGPVEVTIAYSSPDVHGLW